MLRLSKAPSIPLISGSGAVPGSEKEIQRKKVRASSRRIEK